MNRWRKRLRVTLWAALALAAALVGAEVFLRLTGLGVPYGMDSFGRRRSVLASSHERPARRIVCLGDSMTFGCRVREEESFPSRLQGLLDGAAAGDFDVVNAGINGHTSVQTLERVERDVLAFSPEAVVLWIGTNDAMLRRQSDGGPGHRPADRPMILTRSVLLTTLEAMPPLTALSCRLARPSGPPDRLVPRVPEPTFRQAYEGLLRTFTRAGVRRVICLTLPRVPDHFQAGAAPALVAAQRDSHARYSQAIREIAPRFGATVLDVTAVLGCDNPSGFLADGLHLSRDGGLRIAAALAPLLRAPLGPRGADNAGCPPSKCR